MRSMVPSPQRENQSQGKGKKARQREHIHTLYTVFTSFNKLFSALCTHLGSLNIPSLTSAHQIISALFCVIPLFSCFCQNITLLQAVFCYQSFFPFSTFNFFSQAHLSTSKALPRIGDCTGTVLLWLSDIETTDPKNCNVYMSFTLKERKSQGLGVKQRQNCVVPLPQKRFHRVLTCS